MRVASTLDVRSLGALLLLCCTAAAAQTRAGRCWAACERQVPDPRLRATACGACVTAPDDAAAFLARLPAPPAAALEDPDWQVRWGALQKPAAQALAKWLLQARGGELERACLTALHAAGARQQPLRTLLDSQAARARCEAIQPALDLALQQELYAEAAATRREALAHAALAFERPPARVVLDALPGHPPGFDAQVLQTLEAVSLADARSPAAALLAAATPADAPVMNRVLAVYGPRRDSARAALRSDDEQVRREAIADLAPLAPLSEEELLTALLDARPALRLAAARGLARGEGTPLGPFVAGRLTNPGAATPAHQLALLELLGEVRPPDCAAISLLAFRDETQPPALRAPALVVAAGCDWTAAHPQLRAALQAPQPWQRAAAIEAMGAGPHSEQLSEELSRATGAPEPVVRAAACRAIARRRWRGGAERVSALSGDGEAAVRVAALTAQAALEARGTAARLVSALERDPSPEVRAAAAALLATIGDARALSALRRAAGNDRDPNVKLVASQSLRKLAPGSPAP